MCWGGAILSEWALSSRSATRGVQSSLDMFESLNQAKPHGAMWHRAQLSVRPFPRRPSHRQDRSPSKSPTSTKSVARSMSCRRECPRWSVDAGPRVAVAQAQAPAHGPGADGHGNRLGHRLAARHATPCQLRAVPSVVNAIAESWSDGRYNLQVIDHMIGDYRGGRGGFPTAVKTECRRCTTLSAVAAVPYLTGGRDPSCDSVDGD